MDKCLRVSFSLCVHARINSARNCVHSVALSNHLLCFKDTDYHNRPLLILHCSQENVSSLETVKRGFLMQIATSTFCFGEFPRLAAHCGDADKYSFFLVQRVKLRLICGPTRSLAKSNPHRSVAHSLFVSSSKTELIAI